MTARRLGFAAALLALFVICTPAQQPSLNIKWSKGPTTAKIGTGIAEIDVPSGFMFAGPEDTQKLLKSWENPIAGNELGMIAPDSQYEDWVVVFTFDDIGYVEDKDRSSLDATAILDDLKEGNENGNKLREKEGWETVELVGWQKPPFYDDKTNNLTWATRLRAKSSGETINHSIRLLGRRGVMEVDLVASPTEYSGAVPKVDSLLAGYRFVQGSRYADFVSGTDKVAEYGLAALITGGAVAAAAKSGLLGKFWKLIVAGVAAIGVALKKLFGRKTEA